MKTIKELLAAYRSQRNFNAENYVNLKVEAIRKHFKEHNLTSCVIGISGGIDSAVTYHLMVEALGAANVYPMSLPIFNSVGTTGQDVASTLAFQLIPGLVVKNLSDLSAVANNVVGTRSPFSVGQVDYWLRPVVLYGVVARLAAANIKAVVVGTINRDEGSYIGYFGKHTDVCDVQVISDLHKSEVYEVARYYNVPLEIIERAPEGNVYNAKTDEELIGASYDMVELYTGYVLQHPDCIQDLSIESLVEFNSAHTAIEHRRCETYFKYDNGLSCYFIDVQDRTVPNGWK